MNIVNGSAGKESWTFLSRHILLGWLVWYFHRERSRCQFYSKSPKKTWIGNWINTLKSTLNLRSCHTSFSVSFWVGVPRIVLIWVTRSSVLPGVEYTPTVHKGGEQGVRTPFLTSRHWGPDPVDDMLVSLRTLSIETSFNRMWLGGEVFRVKLSSEETIHMGPLLRNSSLRVRQWQASHYVWLVWNAWSNPGWP